MSAIFETLLNAQRKFPGAETGAARGATVKVSCPAGQVSCTGTVTLVTTAAAAGRSNAAKDKRPAPLTLGHGHFHLKGATSKTIHVKLSAKAIALLRHDHRLKVTATIRDTNSAGKTTTTSKRLTLHYAPHKHAAKNKRK